MSLSRAHLSRISVDWVINTLSMQFRALFPLMASAQAKTSKISSSVRCNPSNKITAFPQNYLLWTPRNPYCRFKSSEDPLISHMSLLRMSNSSNNLKIISINSIISSCSNIMAIRNNNQSTSLPTNNSNTKPNYSNSNNSSNNINKVSNRASPIPNNSSKIPSILNSNSNNQSTNKLGTHKTILQATRKALNLNPNHAPPIKNLSASPLL